MYHLLQACYQSPQNQSRSYDEAANHGRRAVQANPRFSVSHCVLAAALAQLGQKEHTKAAAMEVRALEPSFSSSGMCFAFAIVPTLAEPLTKAWLEAGLPP
jgi:hypothetical protein